MRCIVVGGGAAGFFCAVTAARMNPALDVSIFEKTGKVLSKVRISGGGRCNVTHACFSIAEMMRGYPRGAHFVKKAFHQFFTEDTIAWFLERGVALKAERDGRMFPVTDNSETITGCLMREADKHKVKLCLHKSVQTIYKEGGRWRVGLTNGETETTDILCIACGGYGKETMFEWLKPTGHSVQAPVPSLFTFNAPANPITALTGISTGAKIKIQGTKLEEQGPVLITHWGLSGPAVLRLSAKAARELAELNYHFTVILNWCPFLTEQQLRDLVLTMKAGHGSRAVAGRHGIEIPQRLWEYLCKASGIEDDLRWADLPAIKMKRLISNVVAHQLRVNGKTTFKEEFVTAGGITLSEINPHTMESKLERGLFFAGEVMDVDGITGGFNFQHAWTSGWIAGKNLADFRIFAPPN